MLKVDSDKTIHITRGDSGDIVVTANEPTGNLYEFVPNDIIRLNVTTKGNVKEVVLTKDVKVQNKTTEVDILLESEDTKIGEIINKPVTFWYDIELNPDTESNTIIGYDEDGAKLFILYPESKGE